MTPEQIIEMAKQANIDWDDAGVCTEYRVGLSELKAFAQLVRNEVLEEAAKACSSVYYKHIGEGYAEVRYGIAACEKEIQGLKS